MGLYIFNAMERSNIPRNTPGIYRILSTLNGKFYIGSSYSLKIRKQNHLLDLKNGRHDNTYLQKHADKYGINDLCFKIVELCPKEKLIEREQYYIDTLKPEFNIALIAGSNLGIKHTKESKQRHAVALRKRIKNETPQEYKIRCQKCREIRLKSLKEFPEQNAKISEGLKRYYKKHPEYREYQKQYRKGTATGEKNPMYGKSVYSVWVEKYGKVEADIRKQKTIEKQSKKMKEIRATIKWNNNGKIKVQSLK